MLQETVFTVAEHVYIQITVDQKQILLFSCPSPLFLSPSLVHERILALFCIEYTLNLRFISISMIPARPNVVG